MLVICSGVTGVEDLWDLMNQTAGRKKRGSKGLVSTLFQLGVFTEGGVHVGVCVCLPLQLNTFEVTNSAHLAINTSRTGRTPTLANVQSGKRTKMGLGLDKQREIKGWCAHILHRPAPQHPGSSARRADHF